MNSLLVHSPLLAAAGDYLLLATLILGPVLAAYGVFQLVNDLRSSTRRKITSRLTGRSSAGASEGPARVAAEDLRKVTRAATGLLGRAFSGLSVTHRLQRMLDQANLDWSAAHLLVNLTVIATLAVALLVLAGFGLLPGLGVAAAVYALPLYYLMQKRKRRLKRFVHQLPDVFDLLGQALRAGHSLASGMQLVANELPDPVGTEFARVFQEQNLGLKIEDALQNLADRMDLLDVRLFVTAVLIQRQTGGDLNEVLDKIGEVIRDRIKLHGTIMALTAEGRLSGWVLMGLPVVVFLAMLKLNPDYAMVLLEDPTGQMALTVACVMMLMGYAMIQKIVTIKV